MNRSRSCRRIPAARGAFVVAFVAAMLACPDCRTLASCNALAAEATPRSDEFEGALPEEATKLITQGRVAFTQGRRALERNDTEGQEAFVVAVQDFNAARKLAPESPLPLYLLGAAEAEIPGRELRAICWFEAFLALAPQSDKADMVRATISDELELRARLRLDHTVMGWTAPRTASACQDGRCHQPI
jgi:hypothetical protein